MQNNIVESIINEKVIAIIRGVEDDKLLSVIQAIYDGGIRIAEITYSDGNPVSDNKTANAIKLATDKFGDKMLIGAGTVTSVHQVELTHNSNGKFVISPDTFSDVIKRTKELDMVSIPGAATPTDVASALRAGADFIKIFPAAPLGEGYIKALKGPFSYVKFLAVGGINYENMPSYFKAGACGFGIGANIIDKNLVNCGDYEGICELAKKYVSTAKELA